MEEVEEEVKDRKVENRMNRSGKRKDADYGSIPGSLPSDGSFGGLTRRCSEKLTQAGG